MSTTDDTLNRYCTGRDGCRCGGCRRPRTRPVLTNEQLTGRRDYIAVPDHLLHALIALASHAALVCDPDNNDPDTLAPLTENELDALNRGRDLIDWPPYGDPIPDDPEDVCGCRDDECADCAPFVPVAVWHH